MKAYRTKNIQITLCRTRAGSLYYYGEFIGRPSTGIAMPAQKTTDGFTARNDPYRYEIHGSTVTVTLNGRELSKERLSPEPSPS